MSNFDIVRAWKDSDYRHNLSSDELAQLPANPAGTIELTDDLLDMIAAGQEVATAINFTSGCCQTIYNSCYSTCLGKSTCSCLCSF